MKQIRKSLSKSKLKPQMQHVYMEHNDGSITLTATDAFRLVHLNSSRWRVEGELNLPDNWYISGKDINHLTKAYRYTITGIDTERQQFELLLDDESGSPMKTEKLSYEKTEEIGEYPDYIQLLKTARERESVSVSFNAKFMIDAMEQLRNCGNIDEFSKVTMSLDPEYMGTSSIYCHIDGVEVLLMPVTK